jgi:(p)ppGpp synthase/HD superfamily hydrolase
MPVLAAALLHDVLEDTAVTKAQLSDFLSGICSEQETNQIMALVLDLTDVFIKANYPQWNRRKRKDKEADRLARIDPKAQTIKYADIIDNSTSMGACDNDFASVYLQEAKNILRKMNKGDPALYQKAVDTVNAGLKLVQDC